MPVGRPGLLAERQLVASSTLSEKPKSGEACDRGVFIYDLEVVTPSRRSRPSPSTRAGPDYALATAGDQRAVQPPSTIRVVPVTSDEAGEAR